MTELIRLLRGLVLLYYTKPLNDIISEKEACMLAPVKLTLPMFEGAFRVIAFYASQYIMRAWRQTIAEKAFRDFLSSQKGNPKAASFQKAIIYDEIQFSMKGFQKLSTTCGFEMDCFRVLDRRSNRASDLKHYPNALLMWQFGIPLQTILATEQRLQIKDFPNQERAKKQVEGTIFSQLYRQFDLVVDELEVQDILVGYSFRTEFFSQFWKYHSILPWPNFYHGTLIQKAKPTGSASSTGQRLFLIAKRNRVGTLISTVALGESISLSLQTPPSPPSVENLPLYIKQARDKCMPIFTSI
ncbi:hypothetical protein HD806DRAFT_516905 [Xylariaceae sp. AK1471]|nr:hypothetical protein HD806DRAFT_517393 [Xylariaceae sp. AK1471]KAI3316742.1 hypothetical protein HD806DRAFT_516905 [Xylariaceae sp. AK1471]